MDCTMKLIDLYWMEAKELLNDQYSEKQDNFKQFLFVSH